VRKMISAIADLMLLSAGASSVDAAKELALV
jgi:hypothetical protein